MFKNLSLTVPLQVDDYTIYGMGEVSNSIVGVKSIIGEFSRIRNSNIGKYVRIDRNNFLHQVTIGDYSYTGPFDIIFNCEIGKYTSISYGVTIGPPEHDYTFLTTHPFIHNVEYGILSGNNLVPNKKLNKNLSIGNDVWIGCNVTILRGITIGDGAVIGANSLINKDIPPYSIVAGCPAKVLKYRFSPQIINRLLEIKWWNWNIERIKKNAVLFRSELNEDLLNNII